MIRVLSVIGTRPEAIKMAPIIHELRREPEAFATRVCLTGQHREMLDGVLRLFRIEPDYDLGVMRHEQSLASLTATLLTRLEPVLAAEQPDWVLVQGDTTSVLAGSLAAFYQRIRLAHVEAGLRTGDKHQPFPEEINRRVASLLADVHFAPTEAAANNLRREGVPGARIVVTGNTVIDAVKHVTALPFDPRGTPLASLTLTGETVVLVTVHRREHFGAGLETIFTGLRQLAERRPDIRLVYPVHLNPNVQEPAYRLLGGLPNVSLLPPLDYQPFLGLLACCRLVITDSGGLQEEAPGLGKPVLLLREKTERPEGVSSGLVRLVELSADRIVAETLRLLDDPDAYRRMTAGDGRDLYGDGQAARRIVRALRTLDLGADLGAAGGHVPRAPRAAEAEPCSGR